MRAELGEDALSEIIGFVLILALVVVASTLYLMYVVPAEGREDEITHMNQVQERFISYKTSVDGLWMRSLADLSVPGTRGVSLSTSFDLGTGGGNTQSSGLFLSFMRPIGTAARMQTNLDTDPSSPQTERMGLLIDDNERFSCSDQYGALWPDVPVGSLCYKTSNYYWIQQNYYYKLGAVFLEQPGEGVSVKVAPPIAIYGATSGDDGREVAKISLSLVNITSQKSTVGGTGPLRVETRLRESMSEVYRNELAGVVAFRILIPNDEIWADAWEQVFLDAAMKSGLDAPNLTAEHIKDGQNLWLNIDRNGDSEVTLKIRHLVGTTNPEDVFLDLNEASLQVTFEYDEP